MYDKKPMVDAMLQRDTISQEKLRQYQPWRAKSFAKCAEHLWEFAEMWELHSNTIMMPEPWMWLIIVYAPPWWSAISQGKNIHLEMCGSISVFETYNPHN